MKFLIVDDSSLSRTHLKSMLAILNDIQIEEAVNGIDALEKQRAFKPDFIFLDYVIPAPDGLAILKIISKVDPKVKVIMMTALGNQSFVHDDCIAYGAAGILTKPLKQDLVIQAIKQAYRRNKPSS